MIFGKPSKPEEIQYSEMEKFLDSSFDKKISNLDSRGLVITKDLIRAKAGFEDACKTFEKLNAEPEKENFYIDNTSSIKSQKGFYSNAVSHAVENWDLSINDSLNFYNRYNAVLSETEKFIAELSKINSSFKKVLFSYSSHLELFKKSFSLIERHRDSLRNELNRRASEYSEYKILKDKITELDSVNERLASLNQKINDLGKNIGSKNDQSTKEEENEINGKISAKKIELNGIESQIRNLQGKISPLTLPLERAARKFDHISSKKIQLHVFTENPIENIKTEHEYVQFKSLLEELGKKIEANEIDEKNNKNILENITKILDMDMYSMIKELKQFRDKKSEMEHNIKLLEANITRIENKKNDSKEELEKFEYIKKSAGTTETQLRQMKSAVEGLFSKYYNRKISISGLIISI
ncbi:MAG: hypothetical protein ABR981_01760 [Candidatus Micrarchaeaceae archaeon]|jgi:chromosome segregation ATPase